ncbi:cell wall anchor protein [Actinomycetes bacterium KLBMP 9797]
MNRTKLSLRRPLTILGATVLGAAAAISIATPASAHHSEVAGSYICDTTTKEWVVTWTVTSYAPRDVNRYQLTRVDLTPEGTSVTNIAATEGNEYPYHVNKPLVGVQRVPASAEQATLTVAAKWKNGFEETQPKDGKVTFEGKCGDGTPPTSPSPSPSPTPSATPPPAEVTAPEATFLPECDGTVKVTLINGDDANTPVELTVTAKNFEKTVTLEPGDNNDDIVVPAGAGEITVTEKGKDEPVTEPFAWAQPEDCGEPSLAVASTCEELAFEVTNPEGNAPITVTFTPSTGEPQTVTVQPGTTSEPVTFPGTDGLTVTPSVEDAEGEPIAWEPEDCGAGGDGGGDGDLPLTGVAIGGIAGGAGVLLASGAVLFFLARRRRMTFTA